jgi:hypothetical protein
MKTGSSIFRLVCNVYIYTHNTNSRGFHLSDSGKGKWPRGARRSYRDLCKSFRVTDKVDITGYGTEVQGPVGSIPNCCQTR